jgi:polar amino acid transport system substrate-binding protein
MRTDKLASIGALVAGMAHEINNPNQAVSMNARFLGDSFDSLTSLAESSEEADDSIRIAGMTYSEFKAAAAEAIREIEESTKRIDHIVQELKRFVRGGASNRLEPTDVNEVVQAVADISRHAINKATNEFSLELAQDLPKVMADRIGLEQVVLNLLQNACQAVPERDRGVMIRTSFRDGNIGIEVIDEGVGIDPDKLPKITDSFFTTKGEAGGTGLGLSVSLRILKEHGGTLEFDSTPGKGTTVTVTLPLEKEKSS